MNSARASLAVYMRVFGSIGGPLARSSPRESEKRNSNGRNDFDSPPFDLSLVTFPRAPRFAPVSLFPSRLTVSLISHPSPLLLRYVSRWHHRSRIVDRIYLRLLFASRFRHQWENASRTRKISKNFFEFDERREKSKRITVSFLVIEEDEFRNKKKKNEK